MIIVFTVCFFFKHKVELKNTSELNLIKQTCAKSHECRGRRALKIRWHRQYRQFRPRLRAKIQLAQELGKGYWKQ